MVESLPSSVKIGAVHLTVPSLQRSLLFYREKLGFLLLDQVDNTASLGTRSEPLVVLHENPDARRVRGVTGLYHFAVLLPSRQDLAQMLIHISHHDTLLQGMGDHGVSESLYLADVDGNGIELYADRQPLDWPRDGQGNLRMGTDPVDIDDLVAEIGETPPAWQGLPDGTRNGHIHLHVADLASAENFYTKTIGFDLVQRFGNSASFFSAGGYHHHVAANTWAGIGAPPPPPNSIGLRRFELLIPETEVLSSVRARIESADLPIQEQAGGWSVKDPSQNELVLRLNG